MSQSFLYVLDVSTGTTTRVAVHTPRENTYWTEYGVAVSPTGSMVAYILKGVFFLLEVR